MQMTVRREVFLPGDAERVWEVLTSAERLAEWFACEVELEARPGGEGIFRWGDGSVRHAIVEAVEPVQRFAFLWFEAGEEAAATRVELELEETEEGTRVAVTESAPDGLRASAAGEWSWGLTLLAALPRLHAPARVT